MPAAASRAAIVSGVMSLDRRTAWTAVPKMLVFSTSGIVVERPHGRDGLGGADFENRPRGKDRLQLLDRAVRGEPAGLNDRDAVAVLRLVEVVRRDEDRDAGAGQIVDEPPELPARQRVHTAGRLVEEDDRRLVENRAAERKALAPAGRERAGQRVLATAKTGHVEHEGAPRGEPLAAQAVDAAEERDVLIDGQLLVEREALRHVADAALDAFGIAGDVDAADDARSRTRAAAGRTACGSSSTCRRRCCRGTRRSHRRGRRTRRR